MGVVEILLAVCMIILTFLHFCAMIGILDELRKLRCKIDCTGPNYTHSLEKIRAEIARAGQLAQNGRVAQL